MTDEMPATETLPITIDPVAAATPVRTRPPIPTVCEADGCSYRFVQGGQIIEVQISAAEDGHPELRKPAFICKRCYGRATKGTKARVHIYGHVKADGKMSVLGYDRARRNIKKLERAARRMKKSDAQRSRRK